MKFQKTENEVIKIIFLDVDGCLSDGGLYHSNGGEEMKKFNVKDGFGIQEWQRLGLKVAIITGKSSQIVANRARELKIDTLFQGEKDKLSRAEQILKNFNLSFDEAAAIGDDINDAKLLNAVAISFKPADALSSLEADVALSKNGGCGAVREMIEILVDKNGMREEWNSKWL